MATFTGDSGDNSIVGTADFDVIDVSQGGDDTVQAGDGSDIIDIGGALTRADHIDGGDDIDALRLSGDYSQRVVFAATTMTNIENLILLAGHDYNLKLNDGNLTTGQTLSVGAGSLTGHAFTFKDAKEADASLQVNFSGDARIITGGGSDAFIVSGVVGATDHLDGRGGFDFLTLTGSVQTDYAFGNGQLRNIEQIQFTPASNYQLSLADGDLAKGHILTIDGTGAGALDFDGSAETDGVYQIFGTANNDELTGGAQGDSITGGGGNDLLTGGGGADTLTGGVNADTFVFQAVSDSSHKAFDLITNLDGNDTIDLSAIDANTGKGGNQAFHLVDKFTHAAGQLTLTYDATHDVTVLSGDVDGDGRADLTVQMTGDHHTFSSFVL